MIKIPKRSILLRHILISSNIGYVLVQSTKTLENANLSITQCYNVMQCLDNKCQQRTEDRLLVMPMKTFNQSESTLAEKKNTRYDSIISAVACNSTFLKMLSYQIKFQSTVFYISFRHLQITVK